MNRRRSGPSPVQRVRRFPGWLGVPALCLALLATPASAASGATEASPDLVAGYVAAPADGLATASFGFKVPTVSCVGESRAVAIGLGDVQDLESPQLRAQVLLSCPAGGSPQYTFGARACSHSAGPLATKHGHNISVTLARSGGTVTMSVTDEDAGTTISASDSTANCDPAGLDAILFGALPVFAPTLMDVPDFNKVKSRDATLNGADLSGDRISRQTDPGIKTSRLRTSLSSNLSAASKRSGDTFSLRYRSIVHCCSATPSFAGAPRRAA
jgi:hypothetical protein